MGDILVVAEAHDGKLKKTTHSAVAFAKTAAAVGAGGAVAGQTGSGW